MALNDFLSGLPIIGSLFDDSAQQALDQLNENKKIYGKLNVPGLQNYSPEALKLAGIYDPTLAQAQTAADDPSLRSQQQDYLMKLAGLSQTGLSDMDQLGYEKARMLGDQISRSGTQAALQNAQARGVSGSGLEFAMREQSSQDAAQRAQQAGLEQAAQSAQQRALYNQAYGGALGNVRAQDFGINKANADILNQFNMANTQARNQGQQYNLGQTQRISDYNTEQRNAAQLNNNQIKQNQFNMDLQKVNGQAGANSSMAQGYAAQNAARGADRNANTGLAVQAGMGFMGYGPMAQRSPSNNTYYNLSPQADNSDYTGFA